MTRPAWIGLGSNLGDRQSILDAAVASLSGALGVEVRAVSSYHETRAVGGPPGQGPFLNAAARVETALGPHQLLATLQAIEHEAGRVRSVRWGERTLDLDLLLYDGEFLDSPTLKLPHPRLSLRRFVLAPLAEIDPGAVDRMTSRTVADLLANLDRRPRLLAIDGAVGRRKASVFRRLIDELPAFGIAEADLGSIGGPDDPIETIIERFAEKTQALRARRWEVENLRVPWIVSDYFLDFDLLRILNRRWWKEVAPPGSVDRQVQNRESIHEARTSKRLALVPTFVLILPSDLEMRQRPGLLKIPQLVPDSDKVEAIVGEVVAACQAIEGS